MSEKRNHSSSDDVQPDEDELSSQANDELAVMEHAAAFDDPIALEHDALAASAEEDRPANGVCVRFRFCDVGSQRAPNSAAASV